MAVIGTAAFFFWLKFFDGAACHVDNMLTNDRIALYRTLASVFASLFGFTIAATSIVLLNSNSPRLRIVRESKHYNTLWAVFCATIRALAFALVISLIGLVFDRKGEPGHWVFIVATFAFLLSCLRVYRAIWVLENIVILVTGTQYKTDE